ncbi:MAG: hypothetical protein ABIS07_10930, partial [Dokdonella sp.]
GGLRCGGTGVDADDVAIGGFGIGFCAGVAGDAKAGAGRVACAVGCGAFVDAVAAVVVVAALFCKRGVGVDGTPCARCSTFGASVIGVCAIGVYAGSADGDNGAVVAAARASACTRAACSGAATLAFATAAGSTGRAGAAGSVTLIGGVAGAADDACCGAAGACGAANAGATTFTGMCGVGVAGIGMGAALRSPGVARTAGAGASFAAPDIACATGGETRGDDVDGGCSEAVGGVDRCAGFAAVTGGSTSGNGKGSVLRTARARGVTSDEEDAGFGAARRGLVSTSSVATGFAAARRSGGFGSAGVSPGGTVASAAGDFRLRGVFGRSVSSMRPV